MRGGVCETLRVCGTGDKRINDHKTSVEEGWTHVQNSIGPTITPHSH